MSRILIVDDEPDILLMLRMGLEDEGHDVVMAADGEMAMAKIGEQRPDLVVLDLMMPLLDGYGVLDRLRSVEDPPPVIVLSAKNERADVDRAMGLGATEFVAKPFDLDRLVALVEATLSS